MCSNGSNIGTKIYIHLAQSMYSVGTQWLIIIFEKSLRTAMCTNTFGGVFKL